MLIVAERGLSSGTSYRLDVSGEAPVQVGSAHGSSYLYDVAVSPDGTRVIAPAGAPSKDLVASTMAAGTVYDAGASASSVAVSPARGGLLAASLYDNGDRRMSVFPLGDPKALFTVPDETAAGHGLALAADGSAMFAVSHVSLASTSLKLQIFRLPPA